MKQIKEWFFLMAMIIMSTMLIVGCLSSCNPQRKIQKAERVLKDNDALAKICADEFPVKEVFIKGDSVLLFDTLYVGENIFDTVYKTFNDTVTRVVTKTLPAKIITKTIRITDTIVKENTARVEAMQIEINNLKADNQFKQLKIDDLKQSRNKFRLWFWILVGAMGAYTILKIKKILPF